MKLTEEQSGWAGKAEIIMMGEMCPVASEEEAKFILNYIMSTLAALYDDITTSGDTVFEMAHAYTKAEIKYIHIGKFILGGVETMTFITMPMQNKDEKPINLIDPDGVFSYVYNVSHPDLSELGYSFFSKDKLGMYHRIG